MFRPDFKILNPAHPWCWSYFYQSRWQTNTWGQTMGSWGISVKLHLSYLLYCTLRTYYWSEHHPLDCQIMYPNNNNHHWGLLIHTTWALLWILGQLKDRRFACIHIHKQMSLFLYRRKCAWMRTNTADKATPFGVEGNNNRCNFLVRILATHNYFGYVLYCYFLPDISELGTELQHTK